MNLNEALSNVLGFISLCMIIGIGIGSAFFWFKLICSFADDLCNK